MQNEFRTAVHTVYKNDTAFGLAIGWTPQKVSKMFSGKYVPKLSEAKLISSALHISLDELAIFFTQ